MERRSFDPALLMVSVSCLAVVSDDATTAMSLGVIDRQTYFRFAASLFRKAGRILPEETFVAAYDRFEGITWYVQSVMKVLYASDVARPTEKDVVDAIAHLVDENAMNSTIRMNPVSFDYSRLYEPGAKTAKVSLTVAESRGSLLHSSGEELLLAARISAETVV